MSVHDLWIDTKTGERTSRYGKGNRYLVRWRDPDGKQQSKTFADGAKRAAQAHDAAMKADVDRGEYFDQARGRVTLKEFAEDWLRDHNVDESSRKAMRSRLSAHVYDELGGTRLMALRPSTIRRWLKGLEDEGLSPATRLVIFTHVRTIILAAVEDGRIRPDRSPMRGVAAPKIVNQRITVWEHDIVTGMIDGAPDGHHALVLLYATCGHRQGEGFAVGVDQIDFLRREIHINYQVKRVGGRLVLAPPKRGKRRTVPLANVTAQALARHIEKYPPVEHTAKDGTVVRVLFTDEGRLIRAQGWNEDVWHLLVKAADMTPSRSTGVHQLRHHYASTLIAHGADIQMVKEYMGHASIQITSDVYGHLFERSHDRARAAIDAAFRKSATDVQSKVD